MDLFVEVVSFVGEQDLIGVHGQEIFVENETIEDYEDEDEVIDQLL